MCEKNLNFALFACLVLSSCSAPKSTAVPDFANTRIKVNTGSAQSASLEAKTAALEIKNSKSDITHLSEQIGIIGEQIQASRMKLAR
jgi:PBP1b-binding outer membrane lipoprotein LpoB